VLLLFLEMLDVEFSTLDDPEAGITWDDAREIEVPPK
jgi:hypothetical protein